ncbi:hypothetical protein MHYP_G00043600 [Metynnis hypsauchen]
MMLKLVALLYFTARSGDEAFGSSVPVGGQASSVAWGREMDPGAFQKVCSDPCWVKWWFRLTFELIVVSQDSYRAQQGAMGALAGSVILGGILL